MLVAYVFWVSYAMHMGGYKNEDEQESVCVH